MEMTPQSLDQKILASLGLVVVQSATLDGFQQEFLSWLLQAHSTSMYVLTQSVSVSTQSTWSRTLIEFGLGEPHKTEALAILSMADEIRQDRNALVHGLWEVGPEPETALVSTVRLDRPETVRKELVTLADLDQLSGDLIEATERFAALATTLNFAQF